MAAAWSRPRATASLPNLQAPWMPSGLRRSFRTASACSRPVRAMRCVCCFASASISATSSSATASTSRPGSRQSPNPAASAFPLPPMIKCAARCPSPLPTWASKASRTSAARYRPGPPCATASAALRSDGVPRAAPRLSIVVLPFVNIGGEPAQDYFVDGVTESLTTDLSRIHGSFVIARNTAFSYQGKSPDARQIGRELNVRYVLEGSVRRAGDRFRVNVQLIDAENGNHLWAERFDKPVGDLFDMQDEIVSRLTNELDSELIEVEAERARRAQHADAMDLYFQDRACWNRGMTPEYLAQ